ncbi:aminomethyltransferase beta-barrel domain-containing protein [uncultured Campylobacter sp.]
MRSKKQKRSQGVTIFRSVANGQLAVFYDNDQRVLASGFID